MVDVYMVPDFQEYLITKIHQAKRSTSFLRCFVHEVIKTNKRQNVSIRRNNTLPRSMIFSRLLVIFDHVIHI